MEVTTWTRGSLKKVLKTFHAKLKVEISRAANANHDAGSDAMRGAWQVWPRNHKVNESIWIGV